MVQSDLNRINKNLSGIVMARWNPGDDVWREHAIHGPDCGFVIHQKGLDFVLEANSSR